MLITSATKDRTNTTWILKDGWGHEMYLPRPSDPENRTIDIGLVGTRSRNDDNQWKFKWANGKYDFMAALLVGLNRPVYLIDVRRGGVGGSGSWCAEQFATLFPILIHQQTDQPYAYIHLPNVAPSMALLRTWRCAMRNNTPFLWQRDFQPIYKRDLLKENQIDVAIAFVEAAAAQNGIAICLCAEEYQPHFDDLDQQAQEACYCHRFTLANQIANRIKDPYRTRRICNLELTDFKAQWKQSGRDVFKDYKPTVRCVT